MLDGKRQADFDRFRRDYPVFQYKQYEILRGEGTVALRYTFEIPGLCSFAPQTTIETGNLTLLNDPECPAAQELAFSLGMVEAVSYMKAACSPRMEVLCGALDADDIAWWQRLYYNGLGEMMYRNGIACEQEELFEIAAPARRAARPAEPVIAGGNLIPVGGGKDSVVSLELLRGMHAENRCFFINPKGAGLGCADRAGYGADSRVITHRTIDPNLLELNKKGFLNGHTPFSAIVAFLCAYCAVLTGRENIVLSNESSANEGNVAGSTVNHQYSKSFEFEQNFNWYLKKNVSGRVCYFSLLRPFNELQIAKYFAGHAGKYLDVFKSCNLGSKTDSWCCNCPKCLFVYTILSAFLPPERVERVFGQNLLEREDMAGFFDGLTGFSAVKPFECIGTREEVGAACKLACGQYGRDGRPLPLLLRRYADRTGTALTFDEKLLFREFNSLNHIPSVFDPCVKEMFDFVSQPDC